MELHTSLPEDHTRFMPEIGVSPQAWFDKAVSFCREYYKHEIDRASSVEWEKIDPDTFFKEYIWVVHATGFSAKAVTKFIEKLHAAYGSYGILSQDKEFQRLPEILKICNNISKAKAVRKTACLINEGILLEGWDSWKRSRLDNVDKLDDLPFIGPITKYHLGRNIGMLDCIKPDLHLVRLADYWKFSDAIDMIKSMNQNHDYQLGIADMIAWYYASTFGTAFAKKEGSR